MNQKLYELAIEAMENAYAPYSKFCVGAAILCSSGKIYLGANIENASYGATICAERVAAVKAIFDGERDFVKIAIASGHGETWPCGICRQFLYEFSKDMIVITGDEDGNIKEMALSQLLPKGFKL
ncbi:MAG: cytidine deaminase [Anaerovoracaceae bacterium]